MNDGAVEVLLAAGLREDIPALKNIYEENVPEKSSLPADVIGIANEERTPEFHMRADAVRNKQQERLVCQCFVPGLMPARA